MGRLDTDMAERFVQLTARAIGVVGENRELSGRINPIRRPLPTQNLTDPTEVGASPRARKATQQPCPGQVARIGALRLPIEDVPSRGY
jgi:hypothetical protein